MNIQKFIFIVLFFLGASCAPPVCPIESCGIRQIHTHDGKDFRWVPTWKLWKSQNNKTAERISARNYDPKDYQPKKEKPEVKKPGSCYKK